MGTAKQAREALKRASDERAAQWAAEVLADRAANAAERNRRLATAEARRVQVGLGKGLGFGANGVHDDTTATDSQSLGSDSHSLVERHC